MANRDIVAIGASAGGVEALMKLIAKLPEDLPVSIFAVVQDPEDALYPDMTQSALDVVGADYCVTLNAIPELLVHLVHGAPGPPTQTPPLLAEVEISRTASSDAERLNEIADLTPLTCAECGGPLWKMKDEHVVRFRCREGHAYTSKALAVALSNAMERSLWVAVQTMDERTRVLQRLSDYERDKGRERSAHDFPARADEANMHAERLRQFLLAVNTAPY